MCDYRYFIGDNIAKMIILQLPKSSSVPYFKLSNQWICQQKFIDPSMVMLVYIKMLKAKKSVANKSNKKHNYN